MPCLATDADATRFDAAELVGLPHLSKLLVLQAGYNKERPANQVNKKNKNKNKRKINQRKIIAEPKNPCMFQNPLELWLMLQCFCQLIFHLRYIVQIYYRSQIRLIY